MKSTFVTVATPSHFERAAAALASATLARGDVRRLILAVGAKARLPAATNNIEVVYAEDLVDATRLRAMAARYSTVELCFALKPFALMHACARGTAFAHYVDSDVLFLSPADAFREAIGDGSILLTPHYLQPFPRDAARPRVLSLLRAGVFNAGYVGVRNDAAAHRFLAWWADNLFEDAHNDPARGVCGDQRWLDLVPVLFPELRIWRDPGANVAYWNLHERALSEHDGAVLCNGAPLIFFHFSGFDTVKPSHLSIYQNRIDAARCPVLQRILARYAQTFDRELCSTRSGAAPRWHPRNWKFPRASAGRGRPRRPSSSPMAQGLSTKIPDGPVLE